MIGRLHDFSALVGRRLNLIVATIVVGALAIVGLLFVTHPTYQASAEVISVGDKNGADTPIGFGDLPSVASSTVVLARVVDKLGLAEPLSSLQGAVKARISGGSNIMTISFQSKIAERAVAIPNAVADEVARYYEEISTRQADADIRKLTAAVESQKQQLQQINRRLANAQVDGLALGDDKAVEALSARLDDLRTQRGLQGAALAGDRALADATVTSRRTLDRMAHSEILQNDPFYKELAAGSAKDSAELAIDRGLFKAGYPGFPGLIAKVRAERRSLEQQRRATLEAPDAFSATREANEAQARKAEAGVVADTARLAALDALIATEEHRMSAVPRATVSTGYLQLQRDAARADYLTLSSRLSTAVANRSLALGSVIVLDRAVRADTIVVGLTRSKLVLMLAALVVAIALGIAFLAESLDPRLLGPDSIEGVYGVPLVTTIKSS